MPFSIATWNINSVRLRMPIVERLLLEHAPDVLCLQETKCPDDLFPARPSGSSATSTSRSAARKATTASPPSRGGRSRWSRGAASARSSDCRHLSVRVQAGGKSLLLHNFYVPAGGDEPDPEINGKFRHKLDFVAEMNVIRAEHDDGSASILVGDLNIAPLEHDVWSHKQLAQGRQPHAGRDRKLRGDAQGRQLGRSDAAQRAAGPEDLHLVELPRRGLGAVRSRPPARSYLVVGKPGAELSASRFCATRAAGTARRIMCR